MPDLRELYQEVILDHNKNPRNCRVIDAADGKVEGFNPLCGDHYTVYVKMAGDTIADVSFMGVGCAISKASASVMSTLVKGKSKAEAEQLFETFHKLVTGSGEATHDFEKLGKLAAFSGVSEFPVRVKCASLAWHALRAALEAKEQVVSTE